MNHMISILHLSDLKAWNNSLFKLAHWILNIWIWKKKYYSVANYRRQNPFFKTYKNVTYFNSLTSPKLKYFAERSTLTYLITSLLGNSMSSHPTYVTHHLRFVWRFYQWLTWVWVSEQNTNFQSVCTFGFSASQRWPLQTLTSWAKTSFLPGSHSKKN